MKMTLFKDKSLSLRKRLLLSLLAAGSCLIILYGFFVSQMDSGNSLHNNLMTIGTMVIVIFTAFGSAYLIFDKLVLQRTDKINAAIQTVGQESHASVGYLGNDEIGQMAAKFDEMLAYEGLAENELKSQAEIFSQQAKIRTLDLTRQSEALEILLKSVEQGISVFDADLNLKISNDQWQRLTNLPQSYSKRGTTLESIVRWNAKNGFLGTENVDELAQKLLTQYEARRYMVFDREYADGIVCEITVLPTVEGGLIFTISDVTELKRVEEALKAANERLEYRVEERTEELLGEITHHMQTEEALLESQTRLQRAQKISQIGYWGWGFETGRTYISEEYPRILGLGNDTAPERQEEFNKLIHADDLKRVSEFFEHVSYTDPQSFELDYRIIRPNGEVRHVREIGELVFDDTGKPNGHTGTIQDVTTLKETELALIRAKEDAEIANRAKSEFLANMSHELRTPLNAIIGFSDILKEETFGPLNSANYMEYVGDIRDSGHHLLEVLNDILDMSKIEAGEVQLDEDTFHIGDEIERSLRFINEKILRKKIDLALSFEKSSMLLFADRRVFKQIFLNLISNAVKFTDDHGKITVNVCYEEDGSIELSVEDNGIGIAEEDLPLIMRPFGQVQDSHTRNFEGTGLGLSLVKNFVDLHQGTVSVDSVLGAGTKVKIGFPKERTVDAI